MKTKITYESNHVESCALRRTITRRLQQPASLETELGPMALPLFFSKTFYRVSQRPIRGNHLKQVALISRFTKPFFLLKIRCGVCPTPIEQIIVGSILNNSSLMDYEYSARFRDRR